MNIVNTYLSNINIYIMKQIIYYSDLDDTITANNSLLYSKIKVLKLFKLFTYNSNYLNNFIKSNFVINNNFLKIIKKYNIKEIFILSRNDDIFIKYFVKYFNENYSKKYGFKIIWWKWNVLSEEKLNYLKKWDFIISDIFEQQILGKNNNFILVEYKNKLILYIYKIFCLILFLVRFFLGKSGFNYRNVKILIWKIKE